MKTIALSAASRPLSEYAGELDEEVLLLTHHNRPVAAVVPLRNVDRESLTLRSCQEITSHFRSVRGRIV